MTQIQTVDNQALLLRALGQIDSLVDATPSGAVHAATPCTDFDVSNLIEHLVLIADRVTAAAGFHITPTTAQPTQPSGRSWTAASARLTEAIGAADSSAVVQLPFGRMPLAAAFGVYVGEFTTHGWDLAAAINRRDLLDEALGTAALALVTARIPSGPREHTPFARVVAVPADAAPYDRLAAWMGRDPTRWVTP